MVGRSFSAPNNGRNRHRWRDKSAPYAGCRANDVSRTRYQRSVLEVVRQAVREEISASAREKAESLLAEQNRFTVSAAQMKALCKALDAPPRIIPRLRKLFSEPDILGK